MTNIINRFEGGMSQDDSLMGENQFVYSHGFDITRYPSGLRLMPTMENGFTSSSEITAIFDIGGETGFGTADGKIYDFAGTLITDTGFGTPIVDGIYFMNYFWVFTQNNVLRYTLTGSALSAMSVIRTQTQPYGHPVIYAGSEMYYAGGINTTNDTGNVTVIDSTLVPYNLVTDDFNADVQGLSIQGNYLRVYTRERLNIVDIGSKTVSYSQSLPFVTNSVVSDGQRDYVTTEAGELFECSGLSMQQIAESTMSDLVNSAGYDSNIYNFLGSSSRKAIAYNNDRLYTLDADSGRYMIYGEKFPGLPKAFCYGSLVDGGGSQFTSVSSIYVTGNTLFLGFNNGITYSVGRVFLGEYGATDVRCLSAVLITRSFDFGDYSLLKQIDEIRVGMEGTGELWASINGGAFELAGTLNQTEQYQKIMDYKKDFRDIAFKLILNRTGSIGGTERVFNIDVRFTTRKI